eukprot:4547419-Pleurochrysis_carterae.AAC.1
MGFTVDAVYLIRAGTDVSHVTRAGMYMPRAAAVDYEGHVPQSGRGAPATFSVVSFGVSGVQSARVGPQDGGAWFYGCRGCVAGMRRKVTMVVRGAVAPKAREEISSSSVQLSRNVQHKCKDVVMKTLVSSDQVLTDATGSGRDSKRETSESEARARLRAATNGKSVQTSDRRGL